MEMAAREVAVRLVAGVFSLMGVEEHRLVGATEGGAPGALMAG